MAQPFMSIPGPLIPHSPDRTVALTLFTLFISTLLSTIIKAIFFFGLAFAVVTNSFFYVLFAVLVWIPCWGLGIEIGKGRVMQVQGEEQGEGDGKEGEISDLDLELECVDVDVGAWGEKGGETESDGDTVVDKSDVRERKKESMRRE